MSRIRSLSARPPSSAEIPADRQINSARKSILTTDTMNRVWGLFDQLVVSGGSFLATILIGRFAGAEELGIYALVMSVIILMMGIQSSLVSTPYVFRGSRLNGRARRRAAGSAVLHTVLLCVTASAISLAAALVASLADWIQLPAKPLLIISLCLFPVLIREFARRFMFAELAVRKAALFDSFATGLQMTGLVLLVLWGQLTAETAFLATAVGFGLVLLVCMIRGRDRLLIRPRHAARHLQMNWSFGRWELASNVSLVLHGHAVPWLLLLVASPAATGIFVACRTIVGFARPFVNGLGNILEPQANQTFIDGGVEGVRRFVLRTTTMVALPMAVFCLTVAVWGELCLGWLFGAEEFAQYGNVLRILAGASFVSSIDLAAIHGLKAIGRPDLNFRMSLLGVCSLLLFAVVLVPMFGVLGGAWALFAGNAVGVLSRCYCFMQMTGQWHDDDSPPV